MAAKMTLGRLARKVDWEGGVDNAVRYGIRSEQIGDPAIAELWQTLEVLYAQIEPTRRELERRLRLAD